jgi:hypothetical protein
MKMHRHAVSSRIGYGADVVLPPNLYAIERMGLFPAETSLVDVFKIRQLVKTILAGFVIATSLVLFALFAHAALGKGAQVQLMLDRLEAPSATMNN